MIKHVFYLFNDIGLNFGLSSFKLDIFVAFCVAFLFVGLVVVIGRTMDVFEYGIIRFFARIIGPNLTLFICNRLTFPGVFLHEMAHAIMVWVTGGKVKRICLFEFAKDGRLGHVEFETRGVIWRQMCQLAFSSSAPVYFGIFALSGLYTFMVTHSLSWIWHGVIIYLMISIFVHMSMSKADLKNYLKGMTLIFPAACTLCIAYQYFGIRG